MAEGQDAGELVRQVMRRLEAAPSKTAAALREKVYADLRAKGLDVERLRADARAAVPASTRERAPEAKREPPKAEPAWPTAPTPERVRQAGEAPTELVVIPQAGPVQAVKSHRFGWPVDRIAPLLTAEEYEAAERLRWAYLSRGGHARIGDYGEGSGRSDPSKRLPVTELQERAARVWNALWMRLDPVVREIVRNFILEEAPRGHERPLTAEEFGRVYGGTSCARRARGVADGALKTACAVLANAARGYYAWKREQRAKQAEREAEPLRRLPREGRDSRKPTGSLWGEQWLTDERAVRREKSEQA